MYELLKEASWLQVSDLRTLPPVTQGNVRRTPLIELIERIRSHASGAEAAQQACGEVVLLKDLNLRRTTDRRKLVDLFQSIAAGDIRATAHDESDGVSGLMFDRSTIEERIASQFVARALTLQQVNVLTGLHYDALKNWVESGLLKAERRMDAQGSPWVIQLQSLLAFLMEYTPLSVQAAAIGSTSRGLTSRLTRSGVPLQGADAQRGALVRISDLIEPKHGARAACHHAVPRQASHSD
jgi:hypothetical protein